MKLENNCLYIDLLTFGIPTNGCHTFIVRELDFLNLLTTSCKNNLKTS